MSLMIVDQNLIGQTRDKLVDRFMTQMKESGIAMSFEEHSKNRRLKLQGSVREGLLKALRKAYEALHD